VALHLTYELYIDTGDGPPIFEALTCANEIELLGEMRRRLAASDAKSIEAWQMGRQILVLDR
jgi:hypothetical protein